METMEKNYMLELIKANLKVKALESNLKVLAADLVGQAQDVEFESLESKWRYNMDGSRRSLTDVREETARISKQLTEHPHLYQEVISGLKQKKLSLSLEASDLRKRLQKQ